MNEKDIWALSPYNNILLTWGALSDDRHDRKTSLSLYAVHLNLYAVLEMEWYSKYYSRWMEMVWKCDLSVPPIMRTYVTDMKRFRCTKSYWERSEDSLQKLMSKGGTERWWLQSKCK